MKGGILCPENCYTCLMSHNPPGLITSTKRKIKSDHDLSRLIRPGDSHCDNINHWPAGTRRSVQDRPISSGINIPDNNGDVTPTSGHCSPHDQGQYFKCNEFIFYLWNKERRPIILELGFIFLHEVDWAEYWRSSYQRRANTVYLFILCCDQGPVSPRSQHE